MLRCHRLQIDDTYRIMPLYKVPSLCRSVSRQKNIRFLIIGDTPLMGNLKNQIQKLNQENHLFLLGFKTNPFSYLKMIDCFVLPSNHEGQPMVLLDAIILEKPIIATDITRSRSVIEGRSGLLVENSVAGLLQGRTSFLNGEITQAPVDMEQYRLQAIQASHQKACCMNGETEAA